MALKRITTQDIADACGLSRNTVSKVFNDRGAVPEATRRLVLEKAAELGYSQQSAERRAAPGGNIAVLTQHKLLSHSFGAYFITSFTEQVSRLGHTMKLYEVTPQEIRSRVLPAHLDLAETAGLLAIELFDRAYLDMVCDLGKPTVFVDGYPGAGRSLLRCDFISMENIAVEMALVGGMLRAGARSFGFVGDIGHCNSFYERWLGCDLALSEAGISIDRAQCILEKDSVSYGDADWLLQKLSAMPAIPEAFVCANDYLAIHLMAALKKLGLSVPGDVMMTGFDGSLEADLVEPRLSTARIDSAEIGRLAAQQLGRRICEPEASFCWTYVKTALVRGDSVRRTGPDTGK